MWMIPKGTPRGITSCKKLRKWCGLLTFALYDSALKIEAGENVTVSGVSGSRRGLKRILISISESLGATNSLIVGSVITLIFIFFAFKAYNKSTIDQEVYN